MPTLEQVRGCLLGLSLGDAMGAPFEGGLIERLLWRVIGKTRQGEMRWTDDTQMSIDLVESYLALGRIDQDDLADRFSRSYRWSRGYGPGAARVLKRIARGMNWRDANRSVYRGGSFGNGGAMRSPILGLIYAGDPDQISIAASESAAVTHAHPLAVEGAILMAHMTAAVMNHTQNLEVLTFVESRITCDELKSRITTAKSWLASGRLPVKQELIRYLGNGIAAQKSCVTAAYIALHFRDQPFLSMQQFINRCGGDADTIGSMAGAIWGVANGSSKLPQSILCKLEQRNRLENLAQQLCEHIAARMQHPST